MNTFSDTHIEQLSAYIDHRLSPAERRALEAQLEQNPALRAELSELQGTVQALRDLPPITPPRTFTLDPAIHTRRRPVFSWMRGVAGLGAFVLIIVVGLGIFSASLQDRFSASSWIGGPQSAAAPSAGAPVAAAPTLAAAATTAAGGAVPGSELAMDAAATAAKTAPSEPPLAAGQAAPTSFATTAPASTVIPAAAATQERMVVPSTPSSVPPPGLPTASPPLASAGNIAPLPEQPESAMPDTTVVGGPPMGGAASSPLEQRALITSTGVLPPFDTTDTSSPHTVPLTSAMRYTVNPYGSPAGGNPALPEASGQASATQPLEREPSLGLLFLAIALLGVILAAIAIGWQRWRAEPRD